MSPISSGARTPCGHGWAGSGQSRSLDNARLRDLVFYDRQLERLKNSIRLLVTGERERAVDDEERYAVHPKLASQCVGLLGGLKAIVAGQHRLGLVPVEA